MLGLQESAFKSEPRQHSLHHQHYQQHQQQQQQQQQQQLASDNGGHTDKMKLTEQVVKSFRTAKTFRENTMRINSLDYSVSGDTLISSSDDESIVIYDCQAGM